MISDLAYQLSNTRKDLDALRKTKPEPSKKVEFEKTHQDLIETLTKSSRDPYSIQDGIKRTLRGTDHEGKTILSSVKQSSASEAAYLKQMIVDLRKTISLMDPLTRLLRENRSELMDHQLKEPAFLVATRIRVLLTLFEEKSKLRLWTLQAETHGESIKKEAREMLISQFWPNDDISGMSAACQKESDTSLARTTTAAYAKFQMSGGRRPRPPDHQGKQPSFTSHRKHQKKSGTKTDQQGPDKNE